MNIFGLNITFWVRQGNNACPVLPPKEVENLAKEEHCYEQNLRKGFKITTNNNDKELWVKYTESESQVILFIAAFAERKTSVVKILAIFEPDFKSMCV